VPFYPILAVYTEKNGAPKRAVGTIAFLYKDHWSRKIDQL
jgi:hypothetical protein